MPKHHCNVCGHDWKGPHSPFCPKCRSSEWYEGGESCSLMEGTCDLCGCEFFTDILQAHYCPHCGSKRWDHKAADRRKRLEDVHPWIMTKVKTTKNGPKEYAYWMASWRNGDKVRNVHLGSCRKLSREAALQKAREMKAAALGVKPSAPLAP